MRRVAALSMIIMFFVWVLPLGSFINPSREKLACGGRRAICMCSHAQAQAKASPMESQGLQSNANSNDETDSSAGGGQYYIAADMPANSSLNSIAFSPPHSFTYRNPFFMAIEHVPKLLP